MSDAECHALAGLFSAGVLRELSLRGRSKTFSRLVAESGILGQTRPTDTVAAFLEKGYRELKRSHRSEYVFRSAIAHKILLGRHSLNTAVMLSEFRVGRCKADVVVLNGTSTAYEIKSDRDRLDRLPAQLEAYREVFARVVVVVSERHMERVLHLAPTDVGVLELTSRGRISTVREPTEDVGRIVPSAVFRCLQLMEAKAVLRQLGVAVPEVPNTRMHGVLLEAFAKLEPAPLHAAVVSTLLGTRNQRSLADLVSKVPPSLRAAVLSTRLRRGDHPRLLAALETTIADAALW